MFVYCAYSRCYICTHKHFYINTFAICKLPFVHRLCTSPCMCHFLKVLVSIRLWGYAHTYNFKRSTVELFASTHTNIQMWTCTRARIYMHASRTHAHIYRYTCTHANTRPAVHKCTHKPACNHANAFPTLSKVDFPAGLQVLNMTANASTSTSNLVLVCHEYADL